MLLIFFLWTLRDQFDKLVIVESVLLMKKRKKKKKIFITIIAILLICLVGFFAYFYLFKNDEIINKVKKVKEPVKKLNIINEDSNERPIAVMINNHNQARPYHSGLDDAYLVYEIVVEGGITRMMAVFKDQNTEKIGSVRSARHYFLDYALENDAVYVHWGWSPQAQSDIKTLGVNNLNGLTYEGTYFFRDKSLRVSSEHTGYTSMELIKKAISHLEYRSTSNQSTLLNYSVDNIDLSSKETAQVANNIEIPYSNYAKTSYVYDAENKVYKRYVNGEEHVDYVTKKQYTAKNIITYKLANQTIDDKGRQDIDTVGSGSGYYITNGYAIPITWEKSSRSSKTIYKDENGQEIKVNDGNTYIQIQPENQELSIS